MQERLGSDADLGTDELFRRVLDDLRVDGDDDLGALVALHQRPTQRVIDRSIALCRSSDAFERTVGLRVLRELDHPLVDRARLWAPVEHVVVELVTSDENSDVVRWAVSCLGYRSVSAAAFDAVLGRTDDGSVQVRFAVAAALPHLMGERPYDPRGTKALLDLAEDVDADVRSYAIMGLVGDLGLTSSIEPTLRAHTADRDEQIAAYCRQALRDR